MGLSKRAKKDYLRPFAKPPDSHFPKRPSRVQGPEAWSAALRPCEGALLTTQELPASGSHPGVRGWTQDDRHMTPGVRSRASLRDQNGAVLHRQEADPLFVRPHPRSRADAEPDRGSA